jgi:hypothetical protein
MGHFLRFKYWLPFGLLLSLVALFMIITRHQSNRRKEQQREGRYQSAVRAYQAPLSNLE